MKTRLSTILILLIFLSLKFTLVNAQEVEFRNVTKEELLKQKSDIDSTAGAEILYYNREVFFNVTYSSVYLVTEVHKRIKFYNDRPEDLAYATEKIRLYIKESNEEVSKIKAYSYNLKNNYIEETKLDKSQIFENELSESTAEVSFTLPKVKKGTVVDFTYRIQSPYYWSIDEFQFQFDIPAKKISAKIYTPQDFRFNRINKGYIVPKFKEETKVDQRLGGNAVVYNYDVENVVPLKEESLVDNIENYRGGVLFELTYLKRSNGTIKNFAQTWADVAKTIAYTEDYDYNIKRDGVFKDDIDFIVDKNLETVELAKEILSHAQKSIKWNGRKSKYFQNGIRNAYKENSGNSADVNLSLVAMLRYAGINASPIIISTRDNLKPLYPTVDRLNYVIAYFKHNNEDYYLDATDPFSEINILPIRAYNWNGIMVDNPNKVWKLVDLKIPQPSKYSSIISGTLNEEGIIKGKISVKKENHYAYLAKKKYNALAEEDYLIEKEENLNNILIENYEAENIYDSGDFKESYSYEYENAVDIIGDKIFLKPILFYKDQENFFKEKERKYPIDFIFPFKDKYLINLKIPENYEVSSLPKSLKIKFGESSAYYQFILSNNGKFIRLAVDYELMQTKIAPQDYNTLKEFYDQKIAKEEEQIVLTKIK
ncbi:protein of unknown function [Mesonia phycicola]|uniref:Transglutaminase-like superfamily protein n=1 Tax=Mesonia phycicola TaxID=579105 RepID=A0A1M6GRG2_9FLAO|nr:hypothetical protein [Mesonia phycicola]SHJ12545.1 protein of unknown function [Mesonia phycicola]